MSPFSLTNREMPWLCLWCIQFGVWVSIVVSTSLGTFPTDWDTLTYHLPMVDHWLQAGSLFAPDCGRWTTPGNNELVALWATSPFTGDFLSSLNNLPCTILFACSAVGFGTRIGLSPTLANLVGFALTANVVVVTQLTDNENDVAVVASFFSAACYTFRFAMYPSRSIAFLAGMSLGLLAGTKFYACGYALLGLVSFLFVAAACQGRRAARTAFSFGVIGTVAWGAYWYVRNYIVTGSPVFPKELFLSQDTITQMNPEMATSSLFGNGSPEILPLYIKAIWHMCGPCQLCGFVLVPFSLLWLVVTGIRAWLSRHCDRFDRSRLLLALLLAGTGVLLGVTPFAVEDVPGTLNQLRWQYCPVRYGMCFLSMATMILMLVLSDVLNIVRRHATKASPAERSVVQSCLGPGCHIITGIALPCIIAFQITLIYRHMRIDSWFSCFVGVNGLLVLVVGATVRESLPRVWTQLRGLIWIGVLLGSIWVINGLSQVWHNEFDSYYARLKMSDLSFVANTSSKTATICVLDTHCYPFFGSRRQYRVCQPIYAPSCSWLMAYLQRQNVDYIVQGRQLQRKYIGAKNCLAHHPEVCRLISEDYVRIVYACGR